MSEGIDIGQQIGNYRVLEEIGRGGMGVVFKAQQISLDRIVALKRVPEHLARVPDILTRFKREARAIARLDHPSIVSIFDYCEAESGQFYVMEYLDPQRWRPLRSLMDDEAILHVDLALRIAANILHALKAAHEKQLIHRDIKPGNIMVDREGNVKILDFGISILAGQTRLTMGESSLSGTVDYMAPEQGEGGVIDHRCDIYAVGTMLYEMLAGVLPFRAENPVVVLRMRSEQDPTPVSQLNSEVPLEVEQIVQRAMARDPGERFPSAQHMALEIERYFRKQPFAAHAVATATRQESVAAEAPAPEGTFLLEVTWEKTQLRVGINPGGAALQTISQYDTVTVDEAQISELSMQATCIVQKATAKGGGDPELLAELKRVGQQLYDNLLPFSAKTALKRTAFKDLVFRLDDFTVRIPWELLYDGKAFLCRRFRCGRIVSTFQEVYAAAPRPMPREPRFLIVSNPRGDLRAATEECMILKDQLAAQPDTQIKLRNERVLRSQLQSDLREADIVHYSGHARYDPDQAANCGWILSDGVFGPVDVRRLQGGEKPFPLLIFANACQSALPEEFTVAVEDRVFSLANAYLLAGVQNYIGTFCEVLDAHAAEFALMVYREAFAGKSLGQALLAAREHIANTYGEHFLIWASYLMYGDPTRILLSGEGAVYTKSRPVRIAWPPKGAEAVRSAAQAEAAPAATPVLEQSVPRRPTGWWIAAGVAALLAVCAGAYFVFMPALRPARPPLEQLYQWLAAGDYAGAREGFEQWPGSAGKEGLAAVAFAQGRLEEAQRLSDQVLGLDPDASYACAVRGMVALKTGNLDRAVEQLRASVAGSLRLRWQRVEALTALGQALLAQSSPDEAVAPLEEAAQLDETRVDTNKSLADAYRALGREDDALAVYGRVAAADPGDRWVRFRMHEIRSRRAFEESKFAQEQANLLLERLKQDGPIPKTKPADEWTSRTLGLALLSIEPSAGAANPDEGEYLTFLLTEGLSADPRVRIVDRNLLHVALREMNLARDGLADANNAVRLGEVLSARVVVAGSLLELDGVKRASLKVIDTESTETVATARAASATGTEILIDTLVQSLRRDLARVYPLQGKVSAARQDGIELNIGREVGVTQGTQFDVFPAAGAKGLPAARLRVTQVGEGSSLAMVTGGESGVTADMLVRETVE